MGVRITQIDQPTGTQLLDWLASFALTERTFNDGASLKVTEGCRYTQNNGAATTQLTLKLVSTAVVHAELDLTAGAEDCLRFDETATWDGVYIIGVPVVGYIPNLVVGERYRITFSRGVVAFQVLKPLPYDGQADQGRVWVGSETDFAEIQNKNTQTLYSTSY